MIIWKLEIEIIGDDWENTEKYFFKTIEETKAFQEKYEKGHTKDDGSYIPTISSIEYYFEENGNYAALYSNNIAVDVYTINVKKLVEE